jgi:ribosome biogenesis GTPase A
MVCFCLLAKMHENMRTFIRYIKDSLSHKYKIVGVSSMICAMHNIGNSTIINEIRANSDL